MAALWYISDVLQFLNKVVRAYEVYINFKITTVQYLSVVHHLSIKVD